jgi:heme exporter protein C
VQQHTTSKLKPLAWIWLLATLAVLAVGYREAIFVAPTEATMGDIQRIFYYHVINASLALIPPYINLLASIAFLYWRGRDTAKALAADALAIASAEVTILLTSIGLLTGMLWARPVWGIWWTWDERLTTYLLLWLLYVSYVMLRRLSSSGQTYTLAAVLSIFAAVDVPITFMSIRWWRTQHPSPVFGGNGSLDKSMYPAVLWNLAGWAMWVTLVLCLRYALERRRQKLAVENELAFLQEEPARGY